MVKLYLIISINHCEVWVRGPYKNDDNRCRWATWWRKEIPDADIHALDVEGKFQVRAFRWVD